MKNTTTVLPGLAIKALVKLYTNDQELGKIIRETVTSTEIEDCDYYINQSDEFNKAFGVDKQREFPVIPGTDEAVFYRDMLQEEVDELTEAINHKDIIEVADALADIQVFLANAILGFGLKYAFREVMDEVFNSNMSKLCKSEEEADKTIELRTKETGKEHIKKKIGESWAIYYKDNGKVRKSINFKEPDIRRILEQYL